MRIHTNVIMACLLFSAAACTTEDIPEERTPDPVTATTDGEVLVKFAPYVCEILEENGVTRSGSLTRSGILSVDEVLDIVKGYEIERVFPVDAANEDRTRAAGLHCWYVVRFCGDIDPEEAAVRLSRLGEVQKAAPNRSVRRAYNNEKRAIPISSDAVRQTRSAASEYPFDDEYLPLQWHLINRGDKFINENGCKSIVGADVQCEEAWKLSTGDPSVIVAVLDEGVFVEHPDLRDNMWINENEIYRSHEDNDGNGYCGDVYGYNFVSDTGVISWSDYYDSGHASHVAGVIAARNGNSLGISSIAGGTADCPGVRIMSCQIFSGNLGSSSLALSKAIKYAADNGAVILQCSWGYVSGTANAYDWTPTFVTEEEWEQACPLEKDALDYFIYNAGSPNGPIDGGLAIFAGGNEYAPSAGFPGAAEFCVSVAATAADFTPATYSNYGDYIDISAPGGDQDYYWDYPSDEYGIGALGCVLSTLPYNISESGYGWMEGTSMACPHVSGVAALGLSYAAQLRRHFTAAEFRKMLCECVTPIDDYMVGKKLYYRYVSEVGLNQPMQLQLSDYKYRMGSGQVNAVKLLDAIAGSGSTMHFPNLYIAPGSEVTTVPANYFVDGETLSYTVKIADPAVAAYTMEGRTLIVKGLEEGATGASITASNGVVHEFVITVRRGASDNGWL